MTSVLWLNGIGSDHPVALVGALFVSLSIVCGLAFGAVAIFDNYSGRRLAHGYGGRSGAIATVACVLFVELAFLCGRTTDFFVPLVRTWPMLILVRSPLLLLPAWQERR